jgi:molybdate transport system ATP-binding protein
MGLQATFHVQRESGFTIDVSLDIRDTGITALYGPSGSGKTTILRLLAGLDAGSPADTIDINMDGETWSRGKYRHPIHARGAGFVFQRQQLLPHLNVAGNLMYAIRRRKTDNDLTLEQVIEWMDLRALLPKPVAELSGGESQRVAIARVLLNGPRCILMDEPLGSVDVAARSRILPYLARLHRVLGVPMVYVSHSIEEITYLADYVYLLDAGRVTAEGSVLELSTLIEPDIAHSESAASVIDCEVGATSDDYGLSTLTFAGGEISVATGALTPGRRVRVRIPARDVSIATTQPTNTSILNILQATVAEIENTQTPSQLVRLAIGPQYLLARITRKSRDRLGLTVGQDVYVQIKSVALLTEFLDQDRNDPPGTSATTPDV